MTARSAARSVVREAAWWIGGGARLAWRRKGWLALWSCLVLMLVTYGGVDLLELVLPSATLVLFLALWCRFFPVSYRRWVSGPVWRRRIKRQLRQQWLELMEGCGLTRRVAHGAATAPGLVGLRWDQQGRLVITPALLRGQTVEDLDGAADRLRTAIGAYRLRVVPNAAHTACQLVCTFDESLAQPFCTPPPSRDAVPVTAPEQVVLGTTEDGRPWWVDLRVCTLTAGSSGAGKGSVLWSLMLGLAPAVRVGLVEIHGVDLKGGMELGLGRSLFTRYADRPEQAVVLLEEAVAACESRAASIAGLSRLHTPTTAAPLVLVLIDELASLTAYLPDRELLRRGRPRWPGCARSGGLPATWCGASCRIHARRRSRRGISSPRPSVSASETVTRCHGSRRQRPGVRGGLSSDQPQHAGHRLRVGRERPADPRARRLGRGRHHPRRGRRFPGPTAAAARDA